MNRIPQPMMEKIEELQVIYADFEVRTAPYRETAGKNYSWKSVAFSSC